MGPDGEVWQGTPPQAAPLAVEPERLSGPEGSGPRQIRAPEASERIVEVLDQVEAN